jgi:short-subunit dehydrogenase
VTDHLQAEAAIKAAEDKFGHIDVLVNNAGVGYFAAVEESEEDQIRRMFDINVFGLSRMIHVALPNMRKRRQGFIVNMSSIGGLTSFPSLGYYNATKYAVEGLSEAIWQEVELLGIKVMLVEPSGFRTDWAGRSAAESSDHIDDYAATADLVRKQREGLAYGTILLVDGLFGVEPDLHCDYAATYVRLVASHCTFWKIPTVLV